jgi:CPA1 family monovalent cation:H+ antiporter
MLQRAEAALGEQGENDAALARAANSDAEQVRKALAAERNRLLALRENGTIGDTAFQQLEQALDLEQLHWEELVTSTGAAPE